MLPRSKYLGDLSLGPLVASRARRVRSAIATSFLPTANTSGARRKIPAKDRARATTSLGDTYLIERPYRLAHERTGLGTRGRGGSFDEVPVAHGDGTHTGGRDTRRLGGGEPIFTAPAGPRARTLI